MIGKSISALSNSATLYNQNNAYMIWGVEDGTHKIIGTDFDYRTKKIGNEELENWLRSLLTNNANFEFHNVVIDDCRLGLLIIYKAINCTVKFENFDYIRVGSYTKPLKDHSNLETRLWDRIRSSIYEELLALQNLRKDEVLKVLDYPVYFDLMKTSLPSEIDGIIHYLIEEKLIVNQDNGLFAITNLGAILFAKKLSDFPNIERKAIRVVQYKGANKMDIIKGDLGSKGYASGFEGLIKYIEALLPTNEVIKTALRETVSEYPLLAIREAVANALIHQDFALTGTGPVIEIFDNRIEITNPGVPLVDIQRIIDNPPKSRNEKLASLMRRLGVCEELGSGWDKIASSCEVYQLPAPKIDLYQENTKVTLFSHIPYSNMSPEDKIRVCYWHACLKHVCGEQMNNSSLRDRFGLKDSNSASISRLIKDAVEIKLIKPLNPDTAPKHMKYVPIWA